MLTRTRYRTLGHLPLILLSIPRISYADLFRLMRFAELPTPERAFSPKGRACTLDTTPPSL
jgi:hypothetical protein